MKTENVPEEFHEAIDGLRHGSYTIETFVQQAIDEASTWEEAQSSIAGHMDEFIKEAECIKIELCDKEEVIMPGWGVEDVHERAAEMELELSDEEAKIVLRSVKNGFDANIGVNWDVIETHIDLCDEEFENEKVRATAEDELPLLMGELKHDSSKAILTKRLKGND